MDNREIVDRISDCIKNVQMVISPDDMVTLYCEDEANEFPGKTYLFHMTLPLEHYKNLFLHTQCIKEPGV